ncbi:MAG TPA: neutral zinc metallopeptidase [Acidimicrobiales bacterium]|nr:neutral zinc metallopeptidase [Acidimicrobiales bacterium]
MVKFRNSGGGLSGNLEDRRAAGGGMGGMGFPIGKAGMGGGVIGIVILLITLFMGGGGGGGGSGDIFSQMQSPGGTIDPADDELVQFMSDALDDIQAFWSTDGGIGSQYQDAKLVLFSGGVSTGGCGNAPSSVGPFYCPADSKAYIDLSFFRELRDRFGAPGDFAQVYVLAHELGHHVQNLLGTSSQVNQEQQQNPDQANELSVRMELQADCYAGVWGNSAKDRGILEPGDVEEGLGAAEAVGDDKLGNPNQETWTHGSAEARQRWFSTGFESGDHKACDTFSVPADQL